MNVLLPKNLDINKIKYSELKVMKSGAKSVYVNYSGSKINIQTPVMNIPYGVNDNQKFIKDDPKRKDEPPKYDLTVSFKGIDENPKIKVFHDKMKELEEKIIDDAFANRLAWFKNNYGGNKDTVSNMFSNIIKHDKDKETGEVLINIHRLSRQKFRIILLKASLNLILMTWITKKLILPNM